MSPPRSDLTRLGVLALQHFIFNDNSQLPESVMILGTAIAPFENHEAVLNILRSLSPHDFEALRVAVALCTEIHYFGPLKVDELSNFLRTARNPN